jgi:hypothetical protein
MLFIPVTPGRKKRIVITLKLYGEWRRGQPIRPRYYILLSSNENPDRRMLPVGTLMIGIAVDWSARLRRSAPDLRGIAFKQ